MDRTKKPLINFVIARNEVKKQSPNDYYSSMRLPRCARNDKYVATSQRLLNLAFILALWAGWSGNLYALNDPTQPIDPALYFGTGKTHDSGGWSLQSILSSPERRIAIINGSRVREGDRIGSARVMRIRDSHVLLNTGSRTVTLRLLPQSIKVRP